MALRVLGSSLGGLRSHALLVRNLTTVPGLKHVRVEMAPQGIAVVTFDRSDSKVNSLNAELSDEMSRVFKSLNADEDVKAAVLISGKPADFIAGADITMFTSCKNAEEMAVISKSAQDLFNELEKGKPVVAAINGSCLGGGLEFALACKYRVATADPKTVLGLPEVKLGILPGAGGTQRLPALIGAKDALPLMLTGSNVRPDKARRLGLVDEVVDPTALRSSAIQAAQELVSGKLAPVRGPKSAVDKLTHYLLEQTPFGQNFLLKKAREGVMKQTHGNYPAPLTIIDVVEAGLKHGFKSTEGFAAETKGFSELGMTPESRALVSIFFGMQASKKNPFGNPAKQASKVAVLGAGLMGAGITQVTVEKGIDLTLKDASRAGLARGLEQVYANLNTQTKKRKITTFERDRIMSRITGVTNSDNWQRTLANTDVLVEAVFEDLALKHKVMAEIEPHLPKDCVFASNTSALSITKLAAGSSRPQNVLGMHYFSPVDKMPLLEIITHAGTSKEAAARAFALGNKQGKTCIVVKDVPGFFVNRCLGPYSDEGMALLQAGVGIKEIDTAMVQYGFPVGPMTLADEVGIEVAASVARNLKGDLGVRVGSADPALLEQVVANKWLGRKTGKGMFVYPPAGTKGKKEVNPEMVAFIEKMRNGAPAQVVSKEDIQHRMVSRFVNEAALCLQDGIIAEPTVGDIGAVFGIGFPPFHGGPFRLIDAMGVAKFHDMMLRYRDSLGAAFEPAQIIKDYAKTNKKFHSS